ncbi:hypothetical protein MELB17_00725, partial [Marinobacter sp. ELB17]
HRRSQIRHNGNSQSKGKHGAAPASCK